MHNFCVIYLGSRFTSQTRRSFAQRVLTARRRLPNARWRNVQMCPHGTRGQCSQTGLLAMTSARGPGKGPVSHAMVSHDEFGRKLISVNPWNVANKALIVTASSCTPASFLLYTGYIYRRKNESEKKTFQTSAMHSDAQSVCVCVCGGGGGGGYNKWKNDTENNRAILQVRQCMIEY